MDEDDLSYERVRNERDELERRLERHRAALQVIADANPLDEWPFSVRLMLSGVARHALNE